MQLLSEGCPVKEIAYRLNLGIGTVKVHLSLAYSALGAHNRIEAIRRAGPALLSRQGKPRPAN
jgi:DNA-binding NarL/FixJ family response regulator